MRTELSVSYVDHNMAQFGPENHNDHLYLQSVSRKLGAYHSRPGNGICHQVHLERFARPGGTLLGSDSHTPTCGGMGMLAIGAGGLDVAVAMGGGAFYLTCPRVIGVELRGKLQPWVSAKDIILRLLSVLTTRGNVGCMVEYFGEGVATLPVPARVDVHEHGRRARRDDEHLPGRRGDAAVPRRPGPGRRVSARSRADEGATYDRITKRLHAENDAADHREHPPVLHGREGRRAGRRRHRRGELRPRGDRPGELEPLAAGSPSPDNIAPRGGAGRARRSPRW